MGGDRWSLKAAGCADGVSWCRRNGFLREAELGAAT
jgi:hypothetical protein